MSWGAPQKERKFTYKKKEYQTNINPLPQNQNQNRNNNNRNKNKKNTKQKNVPQLDYSYPRTTTHQNESLYTINTIGFTI